MSLVLLGLSVSAQKGPIIPMPYDSTTSLFTYTGVVEVIGLVPSTAYSNARAWLVEKNGDTLFVDASAGSKLVDRGVIPVSVVLGSGMSKFPMTYNVVYTLTLEFKEGRYRYSISKFSIGGEGTVDSQGMALETYVKQHESMKMGKNAVIEQEEQFCATLDTEVNKLIEAMKLGIATPKKVSDW